VANAGFECEEHNNPADFFLDVINGDVPESGAFDEDVGNLDADQITSGRPEDKKKKDLYQTLVPKFKDSSWSKRLAFHSQTSR
jgi:hypothetical protein